MTKLVIALMFHISTPATVTYIDYNSYEECMQHRPEKVAVLDQMNQESIIIGYSAVCQP